MIKWNVSAGLGWEGVKGAPEEGEQADPPVLTPSTLLVNSLAPRGLRPALRAPPSPQGLPEGAPPTRCRAGRGVAGAGGRHQARVGAGGRRRRRGATGQAAGWDEAGQDGGSARPSLCQPEARLAGARPFSSDCHCFSCTCGRAGRCAAGSVSIPVANLSRPWHGLS